MPRVIHTAQALVDEVIAVAELPRRGGNAIAGGHARYAGGAVNILLAAARSGAECVHAGSIGTGANGDLIRTALLAEGVGITSPTITDQDTGVCFVLLEPSAERTFITTQGAERQITMDSLARSVPRRGDLICVSGYSLEGPTRDPLLGWLEALPDGLDAPLVVLDPGAGYADLEDDVLARSLAITDVWTGNAEEADNLVRRLVPDSAGLLGEVLSFDRSAALVATVLHPGAVVVVRDGPRGCVLHIDGITTTYPGFPQRPLDTNGAGDTHTGVLVAAKATGLGWSAAARRANAAGAIKVTRRGPATAPSAAEIDAFLAKAAQRSVAST